MDAFDTYFTERMGKILSQNEAYQRLVEEESALLKHLRDVLTEEQAACLEEYHSAAGEVRALAEKTMYRQGIKDLMAFLLSNQ